MPFIGEEFILLGDDCHLNLLRETLVKEGATIHLSRIEFRLLYRLSIDLGRLVTNKDLMVYAWGTDEFVSRNELHVYMNRIRKHYEDSPRNPRYLLSQRSEGYILYPRRKFNDTWM